MAILYLFLAIALEVGAAITTRYTEGFTAPLPTIITMILAVTAYFIFSLSLKHGMKVSIGYAIWSGAGVLAVAIIGVIFLNAVLIAMQIRGILLIIVGLGAVQIVDEETKKATN